jgi:hypothetical protein
MANIKACFHFGKIHTDLTGAFAFIADDLYNLATAMVFGSTTSASSCVIGYGLMLSLSIAKQRDSLNSQSPVYVGDRQAPLDLLNLLPKGTDSNPDVWLMHHKSIPALPRRNASRRSFGSKRYF